MRDYDAGISCREGVVGTLVLELEGHLVMGHCLGHGIRRVYLATRQVTVESACRKRTVLERRRGRRVIVTTVAK